MRDPNKVQARTGKRGSRTRHRALPIKASEEVWVVTALLHREHPKREDFSIEEILEAVKERNISGRLRPSIYSQIVQHCVANRPASPSRLCYLAETRPGRRALHRYPRARHFSRLSGKSAPSPGDIPPRYSHLLRWYRDEYNVMTPTRIKEDGILALSGLGKELWKGIDADEYVRQLREGWE